MSVGLQNVNEYFILYDNISFLYLAPKLKTQEGSITQFEICLFFTDCWCSIVLCCYAFSLWGSFISKLFLILFFDV